MVQHVCEKCRKCFNRKDAYTKHLQRQKPCITPTEKNLIEMNHDILLDKLNEQTNNLNQLKLQMAELTDIFKKYVILHPPVNSLK